MTKPDKLIAEHCPNLPAEQTDQTGDVEYKRCTR